MTLQELLDELNALSNPVLFATIQNQLLAPLGLVPAIDIPDDLRFGIASEIPPETFDGDNVSLQLTATADESWTLIEGIFTITNLNAAFEWAVADEQNGERLVSLTSGTLTGSFELAGETITLSYDFTAPASEALTGTFPTINLQQLVAEYLTSVTLPVEFPTIDFSNLPVSINPDNRSFTFNGTSDSPWTLIGGTLSLDEVTLNVTGTREENSSVSVEGDLSGRLAFQNTEARLSFEFGDTYELTTTVDTLDLGDVITTLVENAAGIDIPDGFPESLTFENVEITVDEENDLYTVQGGSSEEWVVLENLYSR